MVGKKFPCDGSNVAGELGILMTSGIRIEDWLGMDFPLRIFARSENSKITTESV